MSTTSPPTVAGPTIRRLHHFAWRCKDAEATRWFYEDLLGLPLAHVIKSDHVPSTGEYAPYVHLFFQMADGSYIAFFDLGDNTAPEPSPNTPAWVNHFAMELDTPTEVAAARERLIDAGVDVIGVTDHGVVQSIYFFDPNGLRLELTARMTGPEQDAEAARKAHGALRQWTDSRKVHG
jgi:catechol 2,3-dioxygenase-like lactoylglutathione lyase family enzyme